MHARYLEVTFRKGRAIAAYYHLARRAGDKSARTRRFELGLVVDYNRRGEAIGIEITVPSRVTLAALNRLLKELGQAPLRRADIAPLRAA